MEALAGVTGALLSIYDLTKGVDPALSISDIRLNIKEGGKSGHWEHPEYLPETKIEKNTASEWQNMTVAIVTISDRVSSAKADDLSGPAIRSYFMERGAKIVDEVKIPDEKDLIRTTVQRLSGKAKLVMTTGGTGLGPRDVTPEALEPVFEKVIPGLPELLRAEGSRHTLKAWLSRSVAGTIGQSLVIALPGSPKAVNECLNSLEKLIPHSLHILEGGGHSA